MTPVADADGRDRNVDQFYCTQDLQAEAALAAPAPASAATNQPATAGRAERRGEAPPRQTPPLRRPRAGRDGGHRQRRAPARRGPRRRNTCSLPYWGKYVYHDNNRDINLSQVSMRAITDWYYTAHPPIMHDLHESLSLMYTYSGGPPQNPNLDPILFAELPFFSNWELSQMTKWGMPGVYTHGFMDGWSPGYLGSVAYNHNGMMRMYETQSGRDSGPGPAAAGGGAGAAGGRGAGRGGRGGDAAAGGNTAAGRGAGVTGGGEAETGRGAGVAGGTGAGAGQTPPAGRAGAPGGAPGGGRGPAAPTGRGGGQDREWYRGIPVPQRGRDLHAPQQHELHADRRAVRAAAHGDVPESRARELLHEDEELDRSGTQAGAVRLRDPGAARPHPPGGARPHPARAGHRGRPDHRRHQGR